VRTPEVPPRGGLATTSLAKLWLEAPQIGRVAVVCSAVLFTLLLGAIISYKLVYPEIGLRDAANVAIVLILGGYDNLFGTLKLPFPIPIWLHGFSVLVSVSGTMGIGIVYAFLTERVLSVRLQFFVNRPRFPKGDHVVLIGMSALGIEVARSLRGLKRSVVAVAERAPEPASTQGFPCIVGAPWIRSCAPASHRRAACSSSPTTTSRTSRRR